MVYGEGLCLFHSAAVRAVRYESPALVGIQLMRGVGGHLSGGKEA